MNTAADYSTFWILYGRYGERLTLEQLRDAYFPDVTIKTMRNKMSDGLLPNRTGDVFDTRDVAEWWDGMRDRARRH